MVSGTSIADVIGSNAVGLQLVELGLVAGLTSDGCGVELECPWDAEHTHRRANDTRAVYFPATGKFHCHHGTCAGRGGAELSVWVMEEVFGSAFSAARDGDAGRPPDAAEKVLARYVFLVPENRYLDLEARTSAAPEAFNFANDEALKPWRTHEVTVDKKKVMKFWTSHQWFKIHGGRIASAQTYWPGQGEFFEEVAGNGVWLVNIWRPGPWPGGGTRTRTPVSEGDAREWLDLVETFCANEGPEVAGRLLDWFALVVAAPGVKPGWHPVLGSETHGLGKDLILRPVRHGVGEHNVSAPSAGVIAGQFNDYAAKRLVVVTDLTRNTRGSMTAHDVYETIKPFTEHTSRQITINGKNAKLYQAMNVSAWIITTNEDDALPLHDTDRRFHVIMSTMPRRGDDAYKVLSDWIDTHLGEIVGCLHERWRTMPQNRRDVLMGRAPGTPGKVAMTRAGEDRLTAWTRDRIENDDDGWPDLMTTRDIQNRYDRAGRGVLGMPSPTAHKWGKVLRKLGALHVYKGRQVRLGHIRTIVWALRNPKRFDDWSENHLAQAYDTCRNL